MKTRVYVIALLAMCMTLFIIGANNNLAWAQTPNSCTASLNYPATPQYASPNSPFVVPVSASCASYYGNQLYASGTAYDVTSNSALGSANSVLAAVNGGPQYSGELAFNTPPTSPSDSVQVSVSVYDSPGGNLLTSTTETVPAGPGVQQPAPVPVQTIQAVTTTTVTENQPAYANPYPYPYQSSPPANYQPSLQGQDSTHYWYAYAQRANNRRLFEYIVITVIVGAIIITAVALLLIFRRQQRPQPVWYPAYPAPPSPAPPR